ncbi:hypothetical protein BJV85_001040 [Clostridium acetobutylicum]|uniref:Predicted membrane protein n=1 Tax=Clostridium acetobutylicum (strain ATCC 824 / DSM 792 / JCM 1419 / IAM 19013 / LMG 5710 / NBRC 13948 / NRRL B-527 / VKM B-1787 / 2291 / W) TaxID=272562 RepID=Q97F86_CLOAB|nr:hypothetical protein [Clostridium acetobutylicum]AAK80798.1 Predicted membrane protein [Clostridium acetobutylicum ATCC 824]ADZ21899.1 membrane protein [Clostridium acetobutylicum EA 2018]AEI32586.1 hypothetical protein SMB_G2891 [Clostridium acetobutylicum DSM 1731]PSM06750.1 hypothetical protein C7T89_01425 [Clostridium sp. NJ4]AWV78790.1 hypothetical protein DK921_01425 [Clostridium acetobutylicum]
MKNPYEGGFLHMIWNVKNFMIKALVFALVISLGLTFLAIKTFLHILNHLYIFAGKRVSIEILYLSIYIGIILVLELVEIICNKHLTKM